VERELASGPVYKIETEPDTAPGFRMEQGRIRVAEIDLAETVIQHSGEKLRRLGIAIGIIKIMELEVGNGYLLDEIR
jgi:hypothetical protein